MSLQRGIIQGFHFLRKKKMLNPMITPPGNVGQTKKQSNLNRPHFSLRHQFSHKTCLPFPPLLSVLLLTHSLLSLFLVIPFDQIPIRPSHQLRITWRHQLGEQGRDPLSGSPSEETTHFYDIRRRQPGSSAHSNRLSALVPSPVRVIYPPKQDCGDDQM